MIETGFKNSQNKNFKLYKNGGALLLGYAPLLGIIQYYNIVIIIYCNLSFTEWIESSQTKTVERKGKKVHSDKGKQSVKCLELQIK